MRCYYSNVAKALSYRSVQASESRGFWITFIGELHAQLTCAETDGLSHRGFMATLAAGYHWLEFCQLPSSPELVPFLYVAVVSTERLGQEDYGVSQRASPRASNPQLDKNDALQLPLR